MDFFRSPLTRLSLSFSLIATFFISTAVMSPDRGTAQDDKANKLKSTPVSSVTTVAAGFELNGKKMLDAELLFPFQQKLYEIDFYGYSLRRDVYRDSLYKNHVFALAKKAGKTSLEVDSELLSVSKPSEKELKEMYESLPAQGAAYPFEAIKEHLQREIMDRKRMAKKQTLIDQLVKQEKFKLLLKEPVPPKAQINTHGAPSKGAQKGKVTLVKFSDFYCGQCRAMSTTLTKIMKMKEFSKHVSVVYMPYTLFGDKSVQIVKEAYCAGKQNKFWEFHDKAFAVSSLSQELGQKFAQELSLDLKAFDTCMKDKETENFVMATKQEGEMLGVEGTPSLFVNGVKLLSIHEEDIKKAMKKHL
ncbi:MAG: thioredoxin domain-containing protein [Proteobacteria bacterium]|nr:thioredoxin domain-containing protein [Pseudomonadota bacterium]